MESVHPPSRGLHHGVHAAESSRCEAARDENEEETEFQTDDSYLSDGDSCGSSDEDNSDSENKPPEEEDEDVALSQAIEAENAMLAWRTINRPFGILGLHVEKMFRQALETSAGQVVLEGLLENAGIAVEMGATPLPDLLRGFTYQRVLQLYYNMRRAGFSEEMLDVTQQQASERAFGESLVAAARILTQCQESNDMSSPTDLETAVDLPLRLPALHTENPHDEPWGNQDPTPDVTRETTHMFRQPANHSNSTGRRPCLALFKQPRIISKPPGDQSIQVMRRMLVCNTGITRLTVADVAQLLPASMSPTDGETWVVTGLSGTLIVIRTRGVILQPDGGRGCLEFSHENFSKYLAFLVRQLFRVTIKSVKEEVDEPSQPIKNMGSPFEEILMPELSRNCAGLLRYAPHSGYSEACMIMTRTGIILQSLSHKTVLLSHQTFITIIVRSALENDTGIVVFREKQNHGFTNLRYRQTDGTYIISLPAPSKTVLAIRSDGSIHMAKPDGSVISLPKEKTRLFLEMLGPLTARNQDAASAHALALVEEKAITDKQESDEFAPYPTHHDGRYTASRRAESYKIPPPNPGEGRGHDAAMPASKAAFNPLRRNPYFSLVECLIRHPAPLLSLVSQLSYHALISVYSTSKLFAYLFNSDFELYIRSNIANFCPLAFGVFPLSKYPSLCVRDPVRRADRREGKVMVSRVVPGLKWLGMVHSRYGTCINISYQLALRGLYLPWGTVDTLCKLQYTLELPTNGARIGVFHNKFYWTDLDLKQAYLFICKLDMALNNPTSADIHYGDPKLELRRVLLGQRTLTPLCHLLQGQIGASAAEKMKMMYDGHMNSKYEHLMKLGDEEAKIGRLCMEHWGEGPLDAERLLRPDQLVLNEGYRRGLHLEQLAMDCLLHGHV